MIHFCFFVISLFGIFWFLLLRSFDSNPSHTRLPLARTGYAYTFLLQRDAKKAKDIVKVHAHHKAPYQSIAWLLQLAFAPCSRLIFSHPTTELYK